MTGDIPGPLPLMAHKARGLVLRVVGWKEGLGPCSIKGRKTTICPQQFLRKSKIKQKCCFVNDDHDGEGGGDVDDVLTLKAPISNNIHTYTYIMSY
jgi:hypothetical protein